jgi:hypothetical protein
MRAFFEFLGAITFVVILAVVAAFLLSAVGVLHERAPDPHACTSFWC